MDARGRATACAGAFYFSRRLRRSWFGIPEVGPDSALAQEVQDFVLELHAAIKGIAVWTATDTAGQAYLYVRRGFMQPATCFPIDDIDAAKAYLSGVMRSRANR